MELTTTKLLKLETSEPWEDNSDQMSEIMFLWRQFFSFTTTTHSLKPTSHMHSQCKRRSLQLTNVCTQNLRVKRQ